MDQHSTNLTKNEPKQDGSRMGLQLTSAPSNREINYENNYLTISSAGDPFNLPRRPPTQTVSTDDGVYELGKNDSINRSPTSCDIYELGFPSSEEEFSAKNDFTLAYTGVIANADDKNRIFKQHLTKILSCIYAVFIVTLGIVVYISDIIVGNSPIAETFSMYLIVIAFVYLMFLIIDIRIYLHKKKANSVSVSGSQQAFNDIDCREYPEGSLHFSIPFPSIPKLEKPLAHHYCFGKGRHSGSFYLKLGAAGFCFGHLIHSGLLLGYQIIFLTSDSERFYECASVATLVLDITYPLYSFLLLYFIFKYSNVVINRRTALAKFAFMHCLASSLCFWVWTILREIMDSLSEYKNRRGQRNVLSDDEIRDDKADIPSLEFEVPMALSLTSSNEKAAKELVSYFNASLKISFSNCENEKGLNLINENFSPYLYPFSVEYSILVVGILYIIWQNIENCHSQNGSSSSSSSCTDSSSLVEESNLVIHADCHSANRGLFSGIVVLVISVVTIILFFIAIDDELHDLALMVSNLTDVIRLSLMTITGFIAYFQLTKLDINLNPISFLDDLLLFVCIPAFFLSAIFNIVPAIQQVDVLSIITIIIQILQMLIQTPLIIDGLRRCSNSRELRQQKPGRELITFLIVCNVSLWITQTFEIKSHGLQDYKYEFYGRVLWTILGHTSLPFMMFYRFHSSVCLVDIWKSAYEAQSH